MSGEEEEEGRKEGGCHDIQKSNDPHLAGGDIYIYKLERYALRKVIRSSQDQASSMNQCFLGDSGITLIWGN